MATDIEPRSADRPSVAVVVPTRDRAVSAVRLLSALAAQGDAPGFEVIVVDDGSEDGTAERLRRLGPDLPFPLTVLAGLPAGPAAARNRGWRASRAARILFTDDDCVPDPAWVGEMARALEQADVAVGRTRPPADQVAGIGPFSSYLDMDHNGRFSTCNIGYRRTALEALGGFDETRFRHANGEDTDLGLRARQAGCTEQFAPGALVWHDVHPSSFGSYFRRIRRLDGIVALVARHPEARSLVNAGCFLRSVDKAVLLVWGSLAGVAVLPRRRPPRWAALVAAGLYVWQFGRSYYPPRSAKERLQVVPLAFVADTWTVLVMARSSVRWRTLLL